MRECGMLLPVASLPSKYGIGAFSKEAYEFIDILKKAGQQYWQILPLGPTGFGDSPYQSFSAFAGNPYFIDLDELVKEGLLTSAECEAMDFGEDPRDIDYGKIYNNRFPLLRMAYGRWKGQGHKPEEPGKLLGEETSGYCFYMAVKDHFKGKSWICWDEDIRLRREDAVARYEQELSDEIGFYGFLQIKFEEQWSRLKSYAREQGIRIIGDIPIYVAFDSADSWFHPELFQFDESREPVAVAGCPPDGFSATGQLWGNPLYRWEYHGETGYEWWMKRMEYSFRLYDVVRVDHFRGFDEYYSIPAGSENAVNGAWEKGPGIDIFNRMEEKFGKLDIIAEDLGFLTPSVLKLVKETGFPGMKVLEFAFDSREESDYLPHNYTRNCVVYTGTHDNNTIRGWYQDLTAQDRQLSIDYMNNGNTPGEEIHWDFIRLALASVARLAVIPVQDYLGLDGRARINEPSTLGKNWRWRMLSGEITEELAGRCRKIARLYGRA
ncbi:4-alpha-glucanotransferase [Lacrimispora saccharolytica]|uniref:4-alpha-glucanotransferase n=1 Tax=Lacrimispora saccharolytica (strain ATCC 35040 / DSM 2544 / NRCC 2533 / WM1) TaxID=610130 RepID=D9R0G3_LACSW|nr:4-alpha-glucanotransferase [Lacrimispora saccharolytica]ADL06396.1 4-alpha-glucanotransferase [[Clostridium] saccharolyticum WM1]QRV19511.1 4-alpha-glucanotransferase [Lacrimispora saccharolytica]